MLSQNDSQESKEAAPLFYNQTQQRICISGRFFLHLWYNNTVKKYTAWHTFIFCVSENGPVVPKEKEGERGNV